MPHIRNLFFCLVLPAIIFYGCKPHGMLLRPGDEVFSKQAPPVFRVLLETTKGNIMLEVRREWAPHGADRFYNLVRYGYYNQAAFFRIRTGTWAQFGIAGNPKIAQAWRRQTIPDDSLREQNVRGTVAYAFKDHNGRTTQVFINLRDNRPTFDIEPFVPFAKVISGMDVADSLYSAYGEKAGGGIRAGHQDSVFAGGNHYLENNFPKLDYIRKATIIKE
jgi:cyclophilin family peptidyl-prolyl cis-trans isomerase